MARKGNLMTAIDIYRRKDYEGQRQKSMQKKAAKRKRDKALQHMEALSTLSRGAAENKVGIDRPCDFQEAGSDVKLCQPLTSGQVFDEERHKRKAHLHRPHEMDVSPTKSNQLAHRQNGPIIDAIKESYSEEEVDSNVGVPFSDVDELSETDRADLVPHHRLTIKNTAALLSAHACLSQTLSSRYLFSDTQTITSTSQMADTIVDVEDEFTRELAFYKQCLDAANHARILLKSEQTLFSRPHDFFAEMVKSDDHMGKVKRKITDEAAARKASAESRRQRDLKKFGKQVQIAKGQERDRDRRASLNKIESLKRKRRHENGPVKNTEEDDLFDVALDEVARSDARRSRKVTEGSSRVPPSKRHKKDAKFGFGGKKRFSKSGDALSSGDVKGFSIHKMKGLTGSRRLGKSRRAKKVAL